ncbi:hypothetical protein SNE40_022296 [Patella caerulea]|uniref:TIR domain-containing protein n=1 Tax=Patella caerulea TaxID=87958 RepID=A0AAN8GFP7_PATCE
MKKHSHCQKEMLIDNQTQISSIGHDVIFTCNVFPLNNQDPVWVNIEGNRTLITYSEPKTFNVTSELLQSHYKTSELLKGYNITRDFLTNNFIIQLLKDNDRSALLDDISELLEYNITSELLKRHNITNELMKRYNITREFLKNNSIIKLLKHNNRSEVLNDTSGLLKYNDAYKFLKNYNNTRELLKYKHIGKLLNDVSMLLKYNYTSELLNDTSELLNDIIKLLNDTIKLLELEYSDTRELITYNSLSSLEIRDIEEKDFKVYRCLNNISNTLLWQEFHLKKQEFETVDVWAVPGTLIFMESYYTHLDNSEDITIYHTLNGKIITFDSHKCPYLLLYYFYSTRSIVGLWLFYKSYYNVNHFELYGIRNLNTGNILASLTSWCMTPELYGLHSTVVVRRFQNTSGSLCSIKHINLPRSLNIKYTESNLNITSGTDCWRSGEPVSDMCIVLKRLLYTDAEYIDLKYLFYFLAMLLLIIFLVFVLGYIYSIFTGGVDMETLAGISDIRNADKKYNIFISCVQQDYQYVCKNILPILEKKFKVFVPVRDVSPGRPIPTDTGEAISQSASFIVIASRRYIEDKKLNEFEINMILHNASSRNLIIIRLDDCYIADIFNDKYQVIDLRNQHNRFQLEKILETLPLYRSPWMKRVQMTLDILNLFVFVSGIIFVLIRHREFVSFISSVLDDMTYIS